MGIFRPSSQHVTLVDKLCEEVTDRLLLKSLVVSDYQNRVHGGLTLIVNMAVKEHTFSGIDDKVPSRDPPQRFSLGERGILLGIIPVATESFVTDVKKADSATTEH